MPQRLLEHLEQDSLLPSTYVNSAVTSHQPRQGPKQGNPESSTLLRDSLSLRGSFKLPLQCSRQTPQQLLKAVTKETLAAITAS